MNRISLFTVILVSLLNFKVYGQLEIENEIIAALIKSEFKSLPNDTVFNRKGEIKKIKTFISPEIILINETEIFRYYQFDQIKRDTNGLSTLDSECYGDYLSRNRSSIQIDTILNFNGKIHYVSKKIMEDTFKDGGWDNYHEVFGYKPLVKISRPGLNKSMTNALVYHSTSFGGLDGAGFYSILEKVDNKWIVRGSVLVWIS
jgi:hypothetical protein